MREVHGVSETLREAAQEIVDADSAIARREPAADARWDRAMEALCAALASSPAPAPVAIGCGECNGEGWTAYTTADPLPSGEPGEPYQVQQTCDACGGEGRLYATPEPAPVAEGLDVEYTQCLDGHWHAFRAHGNGDPLPWEGPSYATRADAEKAVREYAAAPPSPEPDEP